MCVALYIKLGRRAFYLKKEWGQRANVAESPFVPRAPLFSIVLKKAKNMFTSFKES
jgi:hypothetical protein